MAFGIICEYNPFHKGHLHQIEEIKRMSDEPIVCVMSGNYVQRGEVAIYDKYLRAETALLCGADLVLELPMPYCMASAEFFASAGVEILARVGVDKLCFGSESADAQLLKRAARILLSDDFTDRVKNAPRDRGNSETYFEALSAAGIEGFTSGASRSNDILAIEYTKAILKNGYDMEIYPIKREGSRYSDEELTRGLLPSATALRALLSVGDTEGCADFMPDAAHELIKGAHPALMSKGSDALIYYLRTVDADSVRVAVSDRGLIHKIVNEAHSCRTYKELLSNIGTARYTTGAVRRAIMYLLLGIKQEDLRAPVAYTVLLGANSRGRECLSDIRKRESTIRIVTKPADARELSDTASARQYALNMRADSFYTLCTDVPRESAFFIKKSPVIID